MTDIVVTDHALIRYMERVHDIDMEYFRKLLAEQAQPYVDAGVKCAAFGPVWAVFEGRRLITLVPEKPKPNAKHKHDREDRNGSASTPVDRLNWKALQRKRRSK
jgi:hypothetical protein